MQLLHYLLTQNLPSWRKTAGFKRRFELETNGFNEIQLAASKPASISNWKASFQLFTYTKWVLLPNEDVAPTGP